MNCSETASTVCGSLHRVSSGCLAKTFSFETRLCSQLNRKNAWAITYVVYADAGVVYVTFIQHMHDINADVYTMLGWCLCNIYVDCLH